MRIRTLKPEFWASLTLDKLNYAERLTFIGLWNYADDEGRGLADERLIKAAIWPLDRKLTAPVVAEQLRHMAELGLLVLYEYDGRPYYSVTHWGEHQAVSKPRPSRLPEPSGNGTGNLLAGKERNREQGKEQGTGKASPRYEAKFLAFWEVYPRKEDKADAYKAWLTATNTTSFDEIIAGASRYRDDPNRDDTYTKLAATWLHHGSWENPPLPPRNENGQGERARLLASLKDVEQ